MLNIPEMRVAKDNTIATRTTISELSQKNNERIDDGMESNNLNQIEVQNLKLDPCTIIGFAPALRSLHGPKRPCLEDTSRN